MTWEDEAIDDALEIARVNLILRRQKAERQYQAAAGNKIRADHYKNRILDCFDRLNKICKVQEQRRTK